MTTFKRTFADDDGQRFEMLNWKTGEGQPLLLVYRSDPTKPILKPIMQLTRRTALDLCIELRGWLRLELQ